MLMMQSDSKNSNKNLWKSIKTQKNKYSGIDHYQSSPPFSYAKDGSLNSQPMLSLNLGRFISNKTNAQQQPEIESAERELGRQFLLQPNDAEQLQLVSSPSQNSSRFPPLSIQLSKNGTQGSRNRKFSIGQESVVEQIVDFKNLRQLQLADLQQDLQQPMMMSMGSQPKSITKQIKKMRLKQQLQKMKGQQSELSDYVRHESKHYKELFQHSFNTLIAYILDFYSNKLEEQHQQIEQKKDQYNDHEVTGTTYNNKKQKSQQQTPKFPHKMALMSRGSKEDKQRQIQAKIQQIARLEEQLFKSKSQNAVYKQKIEGLKQQNQQMNEIIFDCEQRDAQFELQLQKKVSQSMQKQLRQMNAKKNSQQLQILKREYMSQILQLEQQIMILQQKTKKQQMASWKEQEILQREQKLRAKQKQLKEKQIHLNQFQVQLSSQKMEMQIKIQKIRLKQIQIEQQLSLIQQKQYELNVRENQVSFRDKEVTINYDNFSNNNFKPNNYENSTNQQANGKYNDPYDLKLKHLSQLKSNLPKKYTQYRENRNQSVSYVPITTFRSKFTNFNDSHSINSLKKKDQTSSQHSNHGSRQKAKINRTFASGLNNSNVFKRSGASSALQNRSTIKSNDKSRLQDLGSKLEHLRQEIRKQIRETH